MHAGRAQQWEKEAIFEKLPRFAGRDCFQGLAPLGPARSDCSAVVARHGSVAAGRARAGRGRGPGLRVRKAARLQPRHQAAAAAAALAQIPPVIPPLPRFFTRHRCRRVSRARCSQRSLVAAAAAAAAAASEAGRSIPTLGPEPRLEICTPQAAVSSPQPLLSSHHSETRRDATATANLLNSRRAQSPPHHLLAPPPSRDSCSSP